MRPTESYFRAAWAVVVFGLVLSVARAVSAESFDVSGSASVIAQQTFALAFPAALGAGYGLLIGLCTVAVSALRAGGWPGRLARLALAVLVGVAVGCLEMVLLRWNFDGWADLIAPAVAAALAQTVTAEVVASKAARTADIDPDVVGVLLSLAGGVAGLFFASACVPLLREGLRFGCSCAASGEGAGWTCSDGMGLVAPVVTLGGMAVLVSAAGATVAAGRRPRALGSAVLAVLALVPLAWAGAWTWYAVTGLAGDFPPGEDPRAAWARLVLPGLACALAGVVVTCIPWPAHGVAVAIAASILFLAALVLALGLLVAILPAAGLAAASVRRRFYAEELARGRKLGSSASPGSGAGASISDG